MIDYGLIAAKLSEIFSDLVWHLQNFLGSIFLPVLFPILVVIITTIILIQNWRNTHIRHL
jgi:hypothetical protein